MYFYLQPKDFLSCHQIAGTFRTKLTYIFLHFKSFLFIPFLTIPLHNLLHLRITHLSIVHIIQKQQYPTIALLKGYNQKNHCVETLLKTQLLLIVLAEAIQNRVFRKQQFSIKIKIKNAFIWQIRLAKEYITLKTLFSKLHNKQFKHADKKLTSTFLDLESAAATAAASCSAPSIISPLQLFFFAS